MDIHGNIEIELLEILKQASAQIEFLKNYLNVYEIKLVSVEELSAEEFEKVSHFKRAKNHQYASLNTYACGIAQGIFSIMEHKDFFNKEDGWLMAEVKFVLGEEGEEIVNYGLNQYVSNLSMRRLSFPSMMAKVEAQYKDKPR